MKYLGGKYRIRKPIANFIRANRQPNQLYIEPFMGSGAIFCEISGPRIGLDIHYDLILLFNALKKGWQPPTELSEELYKQLCKSDPSPLRAFAGFGCSFSGKWFGGYARMLTGYRSYAMETNRVLKRQATHLRSARIFCGDYNCINPTGALIYCDPPYQNTTGYKNSIGAPNKFNTNKFWATVRQWSRNNTVIVSEYTAPTDFKCVLEIPRRLEMSSITGHELRIEKLFMLGSREHRAYAWESALG